MGKSDTSRFASWDSRPIDVIETLGSCRNSYELASADKSEVIGLSKPCAKSREDGRRAVAYAKQANDKRAEAIALTDEGVVDLHEGDHYQAFERFDQALAITRQLNEPTLEIDALMNQALVNLATGRHAQAFNVLEQELLSARKADDQYLEKVILQHLGMAYAVTSKNRQSLEVYSQALAVAKKVGDRQHEADLLWLVAIQHAQLGDRNYAMTKGRMAIDLYYELGNPNAGEFVKTLRRYEIGNSPHSLANDKSRLASPLGSLQQDAADAASPKIARTTGTRLLWQAYLAAKSLVTFFGSGMKKVTQEIYDERLRTCGTCPRHTGIRCRACGCFTSLKAWMPHEHCPMNKWAR